jgi:hypothetical protein
MYHHPVIALQKGMTLLEALAKMPTTNMPPLTAFVL